MRIRHIAPLFLMIVSIATIMITPSFSTQISVGISSTGLIKYQEDSSITPRLHIEGKWIKDSLGNTVYLKGVNFRQNEWYVNRKGVVEQFDYMKGWGINFVRLVICAENWVNNTNWGMGPYRTVLTNIVDICAERGIYIDLMVHRLTEQEWTNNWGKWSEEDFIYLTSMWQSIATTFKSKTNVIYNIYNEPSSYSHSDYQNRIQNIIDAIRTIDPNVICDIAGVSEPSVGWPRTYKFEINNPINRPNIIYGEHLYGAYSPYSEKVVREMLSQRHMDWMISNNRCVVITEFGIEDSLLPEGMTWFRNVMQVANQDGYAGYVAWSWYTQDEYSDYYLIDDWQGKPSIFGTILQQYLGAK